MLKLRQVGQFESSSRAFWVLNKFAHGAESSIVHSFRPVRTSLHVQKSIKGAWRLDAFKGEVRASCVTIEETTVAVKAVVTVKRSLVNGHVVGTNGGLGKSTTDDDDDDDLLVGKSLVIELVSSELDPNLNVKGRAGKAIERGDEVQYEIRFQVPWTFGDVGAVTVENEHKKPIFVKNIVLDCFHKSPLTINCKTWVHPNYDSPEKRFFFTDKGFFKKKIKIGDGYRISASSKHLVFAYYVTGHGFGHATRVVEVARHLVSAGHDVHVVTGAPDFVFTYVIQSPRLFIRKVLLDCGAVQADALTVDRLASLEKYSQVAVAPRASILATEVKWLNSIKADLVVSDVVPVACRAAAEAGIPSICVTNFSWDFIYAEYVIAAGYRHRHHSLIWQIAEDYSHCKFLIRLPGYCPMPAFRDVIDVPLIVRRLHKSRSKVRHELGIRNDVKLVIFNFGGQPAGWKLKKEYLPDGWLCLVCGAKENQELPPNFIKLPKDVYTPDMIAASDCMIGKIGYGTVSEALAYKIPFVFIRRDYFNEEPFLRNMLECYQGGLEMPIKDLFSGHWAPYLQRAVSLKPCYEGGTNGGEVVARIIQDIAIAKNYAPAKNKSGFPLVLPQIHN